MKKALIAIVFVCLVVVVCGVQLWVVYPLKYKTEILQSSKKYNLQPGLVASVICAESRFKQNAKSSSGACGLMQLMPSTFAWAVNTMGEKYSEQDIFNPNINIQVGCFYLSYLISKYVSIEYSLACYNAGEGIVCSWGTPSNFSVEDIKYAETKNYVKKIISLTKLYSSRFD